MKILVLYHSVYGHILKMAHSAKDGAASIEGIEVVLRRAPDFPEDEKTHTSEHGKPVWEMQKDIPVCQLEDLKNADGLLIGSPTRYGNMTAQMKKLIDSTASLWLEGAFEGKPVGLFTSTSTTHGGQETTLISMIMPFLHLGMLIVGVPYSTPGMLHTQGRGGTPYGASTVAGADNSLEPTAEDLEIVKALGRRVAQTTLKLRA